MTTNSRHIILATTLFVATYSIGAVGQQTHSHGDGPAHAHGDDALTHDNAPETEEFFGDAADQAANPGAGGDTHPHGSEGHAHGEDGHAHEGDGHDHTSHGHQHDAPTEGHEHAHPHE